MSPGERPTPSCWTFVERVTRAVGFGIVAGLVISQATTALFDDMVNRQSSFAAAGWGNWFLYLCVPVVAGGLLLHLGRHRPGAPARSPERALAASAVGLAVASVLLRIVVPAILHAGDRLAPRVPRSLADGFTYVADYTRIAPLAANGVKYDVVAAAVSAAVVAGAIAFGAMAFERRLEPVLASMLVGAGWALAGWYVPGGAGIRIIGSLWPVIVLGSLGLTIALTDRRR